MMDPIVFKKNTILQRQRIYQADPRPVYQRLPGSKPLFGLFQIFFWTGITATSIGCYNMIVGKKQE